MRNNKNNWTTQEVREEVQAVLMLAEAPVTAGEVTRMLHARGVNVKRHGVKKALDYLSTAGRAAYVYRHCIRNGYDIEGKHYRAEAAR